eukprot:CAMPEP_0171294114 /NCGR_PEP_ID=MMETSP0816-20121228/2504_1 /TAXON_ID=420281 /ORGANISM="Proboscia inermis, Strain CCAP1064/1" /LENGTH=162 /DNA_ID=CAMNT_0011765621 /DNA_START=198 /DNA_END=683 /DNA_ORIENTATION=-
MSSASYGVSHGRELPWPYVKSATSVHGGESNVVNDKSESVRPSVNSSQQVDYVASTVGSISKSNSPTVHNLRGNQSSNKKKKRRPMMSYARTNNKHFPRNENDNIKYNKFVMLQDEVKLPSHQNQEDATFKKIPVEALDVDSVDHVFLLLMLVGSGLMIVYW